MDDQERIAALEREVAQLRSLLEKDRELIQWSAGYAQANQMALYALIHTHPDQERFCKKLEHHLTLSDAQIVATSSTEDRLEGFQAAYKYLIEHVQNQLPSDAPKPP